MSKVADLERVISYLDSLYELGEDCIHPDTGIIVSDKEYDFIRQELFDLDPNSYIFNSPTASGVKVLKKIAHNPPMTSISKASHENLDIQEEQLFKWIYDCDLNKNSEKYLLDDKLYNGNKVSYSKGYFYQAYKLDGVACAIYYENGNLVKAGLRPRNGLEGEDVTEQVKYVSGVPLQLNLPITCSIRGEIICKKSDFLSIQNTLSLANEKLRANPRNHAAGGIRQFKDPSKTKDMKLSFIAYTIENFNNFPYKTEIERAIWANKNLGINFVQMREFNFYSLEKMEKLADSLDYETDGIVIGVNDLDLQEQLGRHGDTKTGNPRGKIAWKFSEQIASVKIERIEWKTGRTGAVKPVAEFNSVLLDGTNVSRATLHNLGFIYKNNIKIGTVINILKAGKIIPKVVGTVSDCADYKKIEDVNIIDKCPSCNQSLSIRTNSSHELICENILCPSKMASSFCHFINELGILGIGESKIESLLENNLIKNYSDLFKLDLNELINCGFSNRQAILFLSSINFIKNADKYDDNYLLKAISSSKKSERKVPFWKFFSSLGIESAGKSAGKNIIDTFKSLDSFLNATVDQITNVDGVGSKTANLVFEYFQKNKEDIKNIVDFIEIEVPVVGKLTDKVFVFTGTFSENRTDLEYLVESNGGKCSSSVSKKVDYLVVGQDAGSKLDKAKSLGIVQITVDEFKKMI